MKRPSARSSPNPGPADARHARSIPATGVPQTGCGRRRKGAAVVDFMIGTCAKIDQIGMVKQAEDLGVTHFGAGEGPLLFSDPYQFLAIASQQTSTIKLGTQVTNPLTRIAPVTANSTATLNALAPGRTFLGIGTANNALRSMGNRPATIKELVHSVEVSRGLLRGERVTHRWHGQES